MFRRSDLSYFGLLRRQGAKHLVVANLIVAIGTMKRPYHCAELDCATALYSCYPTIIGDQKLQIHLISATFCAKFEASAAKIMGFDPGL